MCTSATPTSAVQKLALPFSALPMFLFLFVFFALLAFVFFCESSFQGGSWALVRRVKQGSSWHPATDNLAGTHTAYGTYGSPTDETTFNVVFSSMVTSNTEFLFMTGKAWL